MKKILPIVLTVLTLFILFSLTPFSAWAAPCPLVGTNIAANFDRKNLEFIAKNAKCDGPIPITVIITPVLVERPELLVQVQKDLKELNFNPTWRPWGFVDPNSPELQDWITAFSYLEIGQLQAWNEWNRYKEAGTINPARDAQVIRALLDARDKGLISIPIGNTPLDLLNYTDRNYRAYWTEFYTECPTCLDRLDFIVSNVYAPSQYGPNSVQEFIQTWQKELNFLKSLGVNLSNKFFIISEAGLAPGAYPDFNRRLQDTLRFAQDLETYILDHPGQFPNLDQITFLLMNDDTGKQYLIYRECDENGENCTWKVTEYLVFNFNVPGSPFDFLSPFASLTCTPEDGGDYDSRPVPCDPCNLANNFCPSCATSFTVHDIVTYERGAGEEEPPHCVEKTWRGTAIINPSDTTIPFVGKKEEEDEQKYLADYFEGTNEYYQNYEQYWLDWINHAGVVRKLTPMEYQNQLKKQMVKRAEETIVENIHEEGVHDYNLNYIGRLCWNAPFWAEALIEVASQLKIPLAERFEKVTNYCFFSNQKLNPLDDLSILAVKTILDKFKIPYWHYTGVTDTTLIDLAGHFPPSPDEEDYVEKWQEWKESDGGKWYKLWVVAPLMSREDTPGQIIPRLGFKSEDIPKYIPFSIEKVPHVARLFEATNLTKEMLIPSLGQGTALAQKKSEPIIASAKGKVLGEKKLLAQGEGWDFCDPSGNACCNLSISQICCSGGSGTVVINGKGYGHVRVTINGQHVGNNALGPGLTYFFGCPSTPGSQACVSVVAENYDLHYTVTGGCCMELDETGTACCEGEPYELHETCSVSGPVPIPDCEKQAITDPNNNDNICGEPIEISLTAVDAFENPEYEKCRQEGITCKPIPGCIPTPTNDCQQCHNPCEELIEKSVNRRFGINLLHPYLTKIWNQTGKFDTNGLFNIFRPASIPEFREIDAASEIVYEQSGFESIEPPIGRFYYNYLGGVQLAKEWVVETLIPQKDDKNLLEWILGR